MWRLCHPVIYRSPSWLSFNDYQISRHSIFTSVFRAWLHHYRSCLRNHFHHFRCRAIILLQFKSAYKSWNNNPSFDMSIHNAFNPADFHHCDSFVRRIFASGNSCLRSGWQYQVTWHPLGMLRFIVNYKYGYDILVVCIQKVNKILPVVLHKRIWQCYMIIIICYIIRWVSGWRAWFLT